MMKKLVIVAGIVAAVSAAGRETSAQEPATLLLQSGSRVSGELVDMNASGFVMMVDGREVAVKAQDVASLTFAPGPDTPETQNRVKSGQPLAVLRNGQILDGLLLDVGGTRPLRLTFDTPSGSRDVSSADVAVVYMSRTPVPTVATPAATMPGPTSAPGMPDGAVSIAVAAHEPWTDTGIVVARGDRLQFFGSGDIKIAPDASSGVGGSPVRASGALPVPSAPVGALIGRVGTGPAFAIGANTSPLSMPVGGRLQLGVNDDHYPDNTGNFTVGVARVTTARRR